MAVKTQGVCAVLLATLAALVSIAVGSPAPARADAPILRVERKIPDEYIVVFEEGSDVPALVAQMERWSGAKAMQVFGSVLPGALFKMTGEQVKRAAQMPGVAYIEENSVVYRIPAHGAVPRAAARSLAGGGVTPLDGRSGAAAASAAAQGRSFGICGMQARILSMEELSVFGSGSRVISSDVDPAKVRLNSFQTLVALQIRNPYLIDGEADCARMDSAEKPVQFLVTDRPPTAMRTGAELTMMWEYSSEVTAEGRVYQERWTLSDSERR